MPERKKSKKQLLAAARRYLKAGWVRRLWIVFPNGAEWRPEDGMHKLHLLLEQAKKERPNPECRVCAEGAVYLSCAIDGDKDMRRARDLIRELGQEATEVAPPSGGFLQIFNDCIASDVEDVDAVFATVQEAAVDA